MMFRRCLFLGGRYCFCNIKIRVELSDLFIFCFSWFVICLNFKNLFKMIRVCLLIML